MCSAALNLRILDASPTWRELDLASELFHRINRVVPENQVVLKLSPVTPVREAIALLRRHGYSQAPVVSGEAVLGVFSYRSFAIEAAELSLQEWSQQRCAPGDLPVAEFVEQFEFARVNEEMVKVFDAMERDNGILVGNPERLIGILTPMDFLRYLHRVASPFVMVSEVELALRALMRLAIPADVLAELARRSLKGAYKDESKIPTVLEDMSFDNYKTLVAYPDAWDALEPVLGGVKNRTVAKLTEVGAIRNDLFHFRREITQQDHVVLENHRAWILLKVRQADAESHPGGRV